jgi:hypothetical protein
MRRLVFDHVARTVAIQRTSLSSPPTVDSLADEFRKLMDELTPETREALGQAFVPIAIGQGSLVGETAPAAEGQLDALDRHYSKEILDKLDGIVSRASALDRMVSKSCPTGESSFFSMKPIAVTSTVFTWPVRYFAARFWKVR